MNHLMSLLYHSRLQILQKQKGDLHLYYRNQQILEKLLNTLYWR